MHARTGAGSGWARRAATVACAVLGLVACHAAPAAADPLSQSFTTPGKFTTGAPPYAYLVKITAQGGSGTAGAASSPFGTNPGGAGGVDVDTQGNIYVANGLAGVNEYPPDASGAATPTARLAGSLTGISGPSGVAVAPPLIIRTHALPAARVGRTYHARLRANLGTTPYRWTVTRGELPAGLRLRRDGTLSGRPHKARVYILTVRVTDHSHRKMTATRRLALTVRPR